MPALAELEAAWVGGARRPGLPRRAGAPAARLLRAPDAALPRRAALGGRRPRRLAQARGPDAHGLAQAQQRARPVPAGQAHGQAADHRRDRRGQHGVATATACALLGLECVVYMGTEDMRRQMPNVQRMRLLGATVSRRRRRLAHAQGGRLGRDPRLGRQRRRHALRDRLVRRPGAVPGARARPPARHRRRGARRAARALRAAAVARDRLRRRRLERDRHVRPVRRRRRGRARRRRGRRRGPRHGPPRRAAHRRGGRGGVLHGSYSAIMQDEEGQITEAHSISAGLDYPGVGPEHAWLRDSGRARYDAVTDEQALAPSSASPSWRGSSRRWSPRTRSPGCSAEPPGDDRPLDLVCLSGRGDKDLAEVLERERVSVAAGQRHDRRRVRVRGPRQARAR